MNNSDKLSLFRIGSSNSAGLVDIKSESQNSFQMESISNEIFRSSLPSTMASSPIGGGDKPYFKVSWNKNNPYRDFLHANDYMNSTTSHSTPNHPAGITIDYDGAVWAQGNGWGHFWKFYKKLLPMILILSEEADTSTLEVMDWVCFLGGAPFKINQEDNCSLNHISLNDNTIVFSVGGKVINLADVTAFWFRRGGIHLSSMPIPETIPLNIRTEILDNLSKESYIIETFIHFNLTQKRSIGNFFTSRNNKIISLSRAQKFGLQIPDTIITTSKQDVIRFYEKHKKIITKGVYESLSIRIDDRTHLNYTEVVDKNIIKKLGNWFQPSLFQEQLDKAYELRVFYLKGVCYTMAIFSQNDEQTKVDFKKYNYRKPNRTVPYILPMDIVERIKLFMESERLDTGSIDLVYTLTGDYVFLEVNPVGQFGMVSVPCNYYLEKEIASFLTDHEK